MSSLYIYQSKEFLSANKATDGTVHLDAAYGACFHTKLEPEPWWMVDLQGIYIIDRIVLYNKQENSAGNYGFIFILYYCYHSLQSYTVPLQPYDSKMNNKSNDKLIISKFGFIHLLLVI
jgi:hypothetical protein